MCAGLTAAGGLQAPITVLVITTTMSGRGLTGAGTGTTGDKR